MQNYIELDISNKIDNLPKYSGGSEVTYTVSPQGFDNYTITKEGNNYSYECNKIKVSGTITWSDGLWVG